MVREKNWIGTVKIFNMFRVGLIEQEILLVSGAIGESWRIARVGRKITFFSFPFVMLQT
jgi:hypothetical protein